MKKCPSCGVGLALTFVFKGYTYNEWQAWNSQWSNSEWAAWNKNKRGSTDDPVVRSSNQAAVDQAAPPAKQPKTEHIGAPRCASTTATASTDIVPQLPSSLSSAVIKHSEVANFDSLAQLALSSPAPATQGEGASPGTAAAATSDAPGIEGEELG